MAVSLAARAKLKNPRVTSSPEPQAALRASNVLCHAIFLSLLSLLKFPLHQQGVKNEGTVVPWGGQDPGQGGKKDGTIVPSNGIRARRKNGRE
jgi:hypothetical protein